MMKYLIPFALLSPVLLSACDAATRYDTGAVVLDVSEPEAFTVSPLSTPNFVSAYEAMKTEDYARAEALLDKALVEKPKDPYALLAMGTVHERSGRFYSAADYYRSAERYGEVEAAAALTGTEETESSGTMTVADLARENLARLKK